MSSSNALKLNLMQLSNDIEEMISVSKLNDQRVTYILTELKNYNKIALSDLQRTGIGRSLNNLRKLLTNESHIAQCRSILKGWKKLVENSRNTTAATQPLSTKSPSKRRSLREDSVETSNTSPPVKKLSQQLSKELSKEQNENKANQESLPDHLLKKLASGLEQCSEPDLTVRLKSREMLTKAMLFLDNEGAEANAIVDIAVKVESTIYFDMNKNTSTKYRSQIRSRVYNLKDSKNPTLRRQVCVGEIDPSRFARMRSDELASDEMKKARQQMTKEAIDEHQMALSGGTVTDLIKCSRCKQNQCTYNQVQTRSADEPMTTFVYCNLCGHRWKFG
ncbi:hypothetical protein GJ496_004276 [Pomphorhynchus laevis]|nr:hypothetical protein GJ496_004276 [Pomphorhynchus laevis]